MERERWRAQLILAARSVLASRQRCFDSDEGENPAFDDVARDALDRLEDVLAETDDA
jgi:hypothetical protein